MFIPYFIGAILSEKCHQKWGLGKKIQRRDGRIEKGGLSIEWGRRLGGGEDWFKLSEHYALDNLIC